MQYTRSAKKAEDTAVKNQMARLICGPKSVEGGSLGTVFAPLLPMLVAISIVVLRKRVPCWQDGEGRAVGDRVGVEIPAVGTSGLVMRGWWQRRQHSKL